MKRKKKHVVVLAGPNGAGKSTAAQALLVGALKVREFVNADAIARGLSQFQPEKVAFEAGRIMLDRLKQLAAQGENFAFETTLASRSFAPWIKKLQADGYHFELIYLWLPSADVSIARVAGRVRQGGHHVPADIIRRRYEGGLRNFFTLYRPIADGWHMYDNTKKGIPRLIASGDASGREDVSDPATWNQIQRSP